MTDISVARSKEEPAIIPEDKENDVKDVFDQEIDDLASEMKRLNGIMDSDEKEAQMRILKSNLRDVTNRYLAREIVTPKIEILLRIQSQLLEL
ncbi:MAG: hypothetical protein EXS55_02085 [Candidatus Magasanikbacteria bacterium]|nr:hypothetical protein [Candidatus Magasanikbacteria bacterium]